MKKFYEQFLQTWNQLSRSGQFGIAATAVVCILAIAAVGYWSSQPQYILLESDLSPSDCAAIVSKLGAKNISHEVVHSGTAIVVAKSQLSQARLAAGDLLDPATATSSPSMFGGLGSDPIDKHVRRLRQQESQLAQTIMQLRAVREATVLISMGNDSPFVNKKLPTAASVVITPQRGEIFGHEYARSIARTMSTSVQGLTPENVTVMDNEGRTYPTSGEGFSGSFLGNFQILRRLESDLQSKVERQLAQTLGEDRYSVQVAANIDFTQTSEETESVEPKGTKQSENITSTKGFAPSQQGVAGTGSNLGTAASSKKSEVITEEESIDSTYIVPISTIKTLRPGGDITRLSVSVVVDLSAPEPLEDGTQLPAPTVTLANVENAVKNAIAWDEERGDTISVIEAKLQPSTSNALVGLPPATNLDFYNDLVRNGSLGFAALVALGLGLMIIRKMKPVVVAPSETGVTLGQARKLGELSTLAESNPDAVADVISAWLSQSNDGDGAANAAPARRAA